MLLQVLHSCHAILTQGITGIHLNNRQIVIAVQGIVQAILIIMDMFREIAYVIASSFFDEPLTTVSVIFHMQQVSFCTCVSSEPLYRTVNKASSFA